MKRFRPVDGNIRPLPGPLPQERFPRTLFLLCALEPERGCVGDQPQHVQTVSRWSLSNAPSKAKLLRLVSATQPRSKSRFMGREKRSTASEYRVNELLNFGSQEMGRK